MGAGQSQQRQSLMPRGGPHDPVCFAYCEKPEQILPAGAGGDQDVCHRSDGDAGAERQQAGRRGAALYHREGGRPVYRPHGGGFVETGGDRGRLLPLEGQRRTALHPRRQCVHRGADADGTVDGVRGAQPYLRGMDVQRRRHPYPHLHGGGLRPCGERQLHRRHGHLSGRGGVCGLRRSIRGESPRPSRRQAEMGHYGDGTPAGLRSLRQGDGGERRPRL